MSSESLVQSEICCRNYTMFDGYFLNLQVYFSIKLTIKAADSGVPSLSSETTLTIKIVDTNDHAPTIVLTPCQPKAEEPNGKFF